MNSTLFPTITDSTWARRLPLARAERNDVSEQIREKVREQQARQRQADEAAERFSEAHTHNRQGRPNIHE